MNWRDSIGASDIGHAGGVPKAWSTQRLIPYSENKGYASKPRRFLCAMCSHVNLSWPHPSGTPNITCLLINFPQLLSLVTLLICSLYNLLVFAVPCGFIAICWFAVLCPALPCLALPCPALSRLACLPVFPLQGCFCLFYLLFINKKPIFHLQLGPRSLPITRTGQCEGAKIKIQIFYNFQKKSLTMHITNQN